MELTENATCNATLTVTNRSSILLLGSLSSVSLATCSIALFCLLYLRLHRKFLYRLAAYQVLASLLHASVQVSQLAFLDYDDSKRVSCVAVGFISQFAILMKLCLAGWITFHIFCFAVLFKNMSKLEPLYISASVLMPLVLASVPFITNSYGPTGEWCWIPSRRCGTLYLTGAIEQLVSNYGPLVLFLLLQSVAMLTTLGTVYRRAHRSEGDNGIFGREQNKKAFRQLLPLVAYPITFCILVIPPLAYRAYKEASTAPNHGLLIVSTVCISAYGFSSGITLIIHIAVVKLRKNQVSLNMRNPSAFNYACTTVFRTDDIRHSTTLYGTFYTGVGVVTTVEILCMHIRALYTEITTNVT